MEQGLPYYQKFVDAFPAIENLANASETEVLRLWQGLGYYSRARNLHATSKLIVSEYGGVFPSNYQDILTLKGIGPYTAAAIASICFNEPTPVVDGNVFRFASRFFFIEEDIAKNKTRKLFEQVLADEISSEDPGAFNQAMMDFGSSVCSPSPKCSECIFNLECIARQKGLQLRLPLKSKSIKIKKRTFHYLVLSDGDQFLLNKRTAKDIWTGLYDFPMIEGDYEEEYILNHIKTKLTKDFVMMDKSVAAKHVLSHQHLFAIFYHIKVAENELKEINKKLNVSTYSEEEIVNLPKPKLIVSYLKQVGIKP